MTRNEVKTEEILVEDYTPPASPFDGRYTKTTQFLLPMVNVNPRNKVVYKYFMNAFMNDHGIKHDYKMPIFCLFGIKNFHEKDWRNLYNAIVQSENYLHDYDCGKQNGVNLVMIVFNIPSQYEKEYYNFKLGRYSRFSEGYKAKFPRYINDENKRSEESMIWQILHKDQKLKKLLEEQFGYKEGDLDNVVKVDEIWDIPRKKREYYRYDENREALLG